MRYRVWAAVWAGAVVVVVSVLVVGVARDLSRPNRDPCRHNRCHGGIWYPDAVRHGPSLASQYAVVATRLETDRGRHGPGNAWCRVSDLRISADWQGMAGTRAGGVLFSARARLTCRLRGRPRMALYVAGHPLGVKQQSMPAPSGVKNPVGAAVEVRPGRPAGAQFDWANWCGAAVHSPVVLRVTVPPRGGHVFTHIRYGTDLRSTNAPPCVNPRYHTEFLVDNVRRVTPANPLP